LARTICILATCLLVIVEGTDRSALTDTTGTCELTGVPAGGRRLYVSIIGYSPVQRGVEIAAGDRLEITIPLRSAGILIEF